MGPARFDLQVRFYELDPYGHVNHATYLQYFEAARVHWLSEVGHGLDRLKDEGCHLLVTTVATRFHMPAVLNEGLSIDTGLVIAKRVQAQWAQVAVRGDDVVAAQRINFATVAPSGRPMRMPESLASAMGDIQLDSDWYVRELPELAL